jgi:hypothetical protein
MPKKMEKQKEKEGMSRLEGKFRFVPLLRKFLSGFSIYVNRMERWLIVFVYING